jgi:hypothetical protein
MKINITFDKEFDALWDELQEKYPKELFDMDGVGKQLDLSQFSKNFFSTKTTTADASIDANANVDDMSVIAYSIELKKPYEKLNSYYMLWKELKRWNGTETANKIIEMQLNGDIYIHDFHGVGGGLSYSYYGKTVVVVRDNGKVKYMTMMELFDQYRDRVTVLPGRETIDLTKENVEVLDKGGHFTKLQHVLRHKTNEPLLKLETKDGRTTIVTGNHPVILADGSEKRADQLNINDSLMSSDTYLPGALLFFNFRIY